MVDANPKVKIDFESDASQLRRTNKVLDETVKTIQRTQQAAVKSTQQLGGVTEILQQAGVRGGKAFSVLDAGIDDLTGTFGKVEKEAFEFDGRLLSILFLGAAIQKTFSNALKSIFRTFREATDNTNQFNLKVNQLNAAWEFLKFSIVDALSQSPLFLAFIQFITDLVDNISSFIGQNPGLAKAIGLFLALGAVFGGILFLTGQLSLGFGALFGKGGLLGAANLAKIKEGLIATFTNPWVLAIAAILLVTALLVKLGDKFPGIKKQNKELTDSAVKGFKALGNKFLDVIGFSVELGDTWRGLAAFGTFLLAILFLIGYALGVVVITAIDVLIGAFQNLINQFKVLFNVGKAVAKLLVGVFTLDVGAIKDAVTEGIDAVKAYGSETEKISKRVSKNFTDLINAEEINPLVDAVLKGPQGIFDESKRIEADLAKQQEETDRVTAEQQTPTTTTAETNLVQNINFTGGFSPESIATGVEEATISAREALARGAGIPSISAIGTQ